MHTYIMTRVYFVTLTHFEIIDMTAMLFITATVYAARIMCNYCDVLYASLASSSDLDAM